VYAPTLPGLADGDDPTLSSLADTVQAVVDLIEDEDLHDVTLVGHSWGGYPITGAAPAIAARLRKLIYWSAFVPAAGRSLYDELPLPYQELFASLARSSGTNTVAMPFEVWQSAFMNDAGEEAQRITHALMVPQPYQYFTETVEPIVPQTLGVPAAYVLSEQDIALPPGEYGWARFADRLGVMPQSAPGSHEACFTQPAALAEALLKA
jgi:pimeloyl-ACP methyl ester carboxylesterase